MVIVCQHTDFFTLKAPVGAILLSVLMPPLLAARYVHRYARSTKRYQRHMSIALVPTICVLQFINMRFVWRMRPLTCSTCDPVHFFSVPVSLILCAVMAAYGFSAWLSSRPSAATAGSSLPSSSIKGQGAVMADTEPLMKSVAVTME